MKKHYIQVHATHNGEYAPIRFAIICDIDTCEEIAKAISAAYDNADWDVE